VGISFSGPFVLSHPATRTRRHRTRFPQTTALLFSSFHHVYRVNLVGRLSNIISSSPVIADVNADDARCRVRTDFRDLSALLFDRESNVTPTSPLVMRCAFGIEQALLVVSVSPRNKFWKCRAEMNVVRDKHSSVA